jgi:Mn2+/Fe2+ NRAMP family transporter
MDDNEANPKQARPEHVQAPDAGPSRGVFRQLGLGLITGAADDDCSAIGTYASAGARFGFSILWVAPVVFPMMFTVVHLSSRLGQISGQGLFAGIREHYPRWLLYFTLIGVLIGNIFEAAADIGAMAAAVNIFVPIPFQWITIPVALTILALQIWGSYTLIRNIFRWLSLSLLAYVGSAFLARPELLPTLRGTFVPTLHFDGEFLSILVAIIGTALSAYIYTWQSNEEVEEQIAQGRTHLWQRRGATRSELKRTRRDVLFGMLFSNIIMYFIMLSTASTLHQAGEHSIETAADAARALEPIAGQAAGLLFALGIIAVGFLAVPIMTTGAAYDLCQAFRWQSGLHRKPSEAKIFYGATAAFTAIAVGVNFFGINPMRALVLAGIIQGFSTPPLLLLILLMTNNPAIMGRQVNGRATNILGAVTTVAIFSASIGLVVSWLI